MDDLLAITEAVREEIKAKVAINQHLFSKLGEGGEDRLFAVEADEIHLSEPKLE